VLGQDGLSYAPVTDEVLEQLRAQLAGWNDDPPGFDWSWRTVGEYLDRLDADGHRGQRRLPRAARDDPHVRDGLRRPRADSRRARAHEAVARRGARARRGRALDGLTYTPGMYADDDELVALLESSASTAATTRRTTATTAGRALEAYADCIEIARRRRAAHLAHAHLGLRDQQGPAPELLAMIDRARDDGIEVTLDTYPYLAGSTYLHAFLPSWMHVGGRARRSSGSATRRCASGCASRWRTRARTASTRSRWTGRSSSSTAPLAETALVGSGERAAARRSTSSATCSRREPRRRRASPFGNEENVRDDDGALGAHRRQRRHPRRRPAAPALVRHVPALLRRLRARARDPHVGAGGAEDDVAAGAAARLPDRGLLRPGMAADVTCIDPRRFATRRRTRTRAAPGGIPYVIVNGVVVVDDGRHTGALRGAAQAPRAARIQSSASSRIRP
jgi:N-acyl-D-amino-acid deacylase